MPDPTDGGSTSWTHKEPTILDDIFFVEAMIDALASHYMIDESRVYACGYSNGGEFTFELACRLSDRIPSIGVVARSKYIETYNNTDTTPTVVQMPSLSSSDGSTVEYYKVIGGGHDWPGSFGNMDIDASLVIWGFCFKI